MLRARRSEPGESKISCLSSLDSRSLRSQVAGQGTALISTRGAPQRLPRPQGSPSPSTAHPEPHVPGTALHFRYYTAQSTALNFMYRTALQILYCTPDIVLHSWYYTTLQVLHCTTVQVLYCTPDIALRSRY